MGNDHSKSSFRSNTPRVDPSCLNLYDYRPLKSPNSIRTLDVHGMKDLIACSIRHIEYTEGGYQALSYVWGSEERPHRAVVVDDQNRPIGYIPLTQNLWNALRNIRDSTELKSKVFWIDQICIDQAGKEKNQQVALMGKIYAHAARVVSYVGPSWSAKDEKKGIQLLNTLAMFFSRNYAEAVFSCRDLGEAYIKLKSGAIESVPLPHKLQAKHNISDKELRKSYTKNGWKWVLAVVWRMGATPLDPTGIIGE